MPSRDGTSTTYISGPGGQGIYEKRQDGSYITYYDALGRSIGCADERSVTVETVAKLSVGWCVGVGLIAALVSLGFTGHLTRARTSAAFAVAAVALSVIFAAPDFQPVSGVLTAATVLVLTAAGTAYLMAPWMIAEGEKYRRRGRESGR